MTEGSLSRLDRFYAIRAGVRHRLPSAVAAYEHSRREPGSVVTVDMSEWPYQLELTGGGSWPDGALDRLRNALENEQRQALQRIGS